MEATPSVVGDLTFVGARHIVMFNAGVSDVARATRELTQRHRAQLVWRYDAVGGFAAVFPSTAAVRAVLRDPRVAYVEADGVTRGGTLQVSLPSWGLDRIDQASLPLSGYYSYVNDGAGVHAYLIDSGVNLTHSDFGGRALGDFDFEANNPGGKGSDCNGHGTFVAGILGGARFGVAKSVALHSVRTLGCSNTGLVSDIIMGVNWVALNHMSPSVANISVYSDQASQALDQAVSSLVTLGVPTVTIAGNGTANDLIPVDACSISPARVATAITVASTTSTDQKASTSNYGPCVDLLAPGDQVQSDCLDPTFPACQDFGTSFAAPHVAGAIALYLNQKPLASPAQIASAFLAKATAGRLTNVGPGTPNLLLSTNFLARGKWTFATSSNEARYSPVSAQVNGFLYLFGGSNVTAQRYAPSLNYWDYVQPLPYGAANFNGSGVIAGKVYLHEYATGALLVYDPSTDLYSARAAYPVANVIPTAAASIAGQYFSLAYHVGTQSMVFYRYDPSTNSWSPRAPKPQAAYASAFGVIGGKLYVIGGTNPSDGTPLAMVEVYDPVADTWTSRSAMPTARAYSAFAVLGSKVAVVGGIEQISGGFFNNIESYDATTDTWTFHLPMTNPRAFASAAFIGNLLFLNGGQFRGYWAYSSDYVTVF